MGTTQLGRMQLKIVQLLWDRGHATARAITERAVEGGAQTSWTE
jgi:hypothetical protein